MRVLHVYSGNLYGGIEAILLTIARHAVDVDGISSEFALCFNGGLSDELAEIGARVHLLGPVRVSRPTTLRRARQALTSLVSSGRIDQVVCHAPWSHALFAGTVRKSGVPLVHWMHDIATGRHWTERWARRTPPDLVIANSRFTAESVNAIFPGVPTHIVYAPVDLPQSLSDGERQAVRSQLDTPDDAVVIVQASRLEEWKGHAVLLESLAQLRDRSEWVCWIAGGVQRPHEARYLESLQAHARREGIADRIRFVGQRSDVARLFRAADIHCQPNVRPEPFGIALVEALAAGLPVVTTAAGGALEIVEPSCGGLVPSGDATALAAALRQLIVDPSMRARLSSAARARARTLCDPSTQIRCLRDALATAHTAAARV
jgi:glycosyltransferase involved in cell wall biosynthesis